MDYDQMPKFLQDYVNKKQSSLENTKKDLIKEIENATKFGELDLKKYIEYYKIINPKTPLWDLAQDIQFRGLIYSNILEALKRGNEAKELKNLYEKTLQLVPEGSLPNPSESRMLRFVTDKIRCYGNALLRICQSFHEDLLNELEFEPDMTVLLQVTVGLPPSLTFGLERAVSPR